MEERGPKRAVVVAVIVVDDVDEVVVVDIVVVDIVVVDIVVVAVKEEKPW